jgi:hypothetical protein
LLVLGAQFCIACQPLSIVSQVMVCPFVGPDAVQELALTHPESEGGGQDTVGPAAGLDGVHELVFATVSDATRHWTSVRVLPL